MAHARANDRSSAGERSARAYRHQSPWLRARVRSNGRSGVRHPGAWRIEGELNGGALNTGLTSGDADVAADAYAIADSVLQSSNKAPRFIALRVDALLRMPMFEVMKGKVPRPALQSVRNFPRVRAWIMEEVPMTEPLTPVPGDLGPVARALAARDPNAEPNVVTLAEVEAILQPRIERDRLLDRSGSLAWVMRAQHVTSMVIDPARVSGPANAKASLINEQRLLVRDLREAGKGLPYMPLSGRQAEKWKARLATLADRVARFSPTHAALFA